MPGRVAFNGIRHASHHCIAWIDDRITGSEIRSVPLTAERHGIIVSRVALNGPLNPDYAARVHISFQRRYGCRVLCIEVSEERVIPVQNDDPILAEVEASKICRRKLSESMAGAGNGVLNDGRAPWIMSLKQCKFVWSCLAIGEGVIHRVGGQSRIPAVWRETKSHPGANHHSASTRGACRCGRRRRRRCYSRA